MLSDIQAGSLWFLKNSLRGGFRFRCVVASLSSGGTVITTGSVLVLGAVTIRGWIAGEATQPLILRAIPLFL